MGNEYIAHLTGYLMQWRKHGWCYAWRKGYCYCLRLTQLRAHYDHIIPFYQIISDPSQKKDIWNLFFKYIIINTKVFYHFKHANGHLNLQWISFSLFKIYKVRWLFQACLRLDKQLKITFFFLSFLLKWILFTYFHIFPLSWLA